MKAKYIWAWIGVLVPVIGLCLFPVWQKLFLWIGSDVLPPCFFYQATGIPCPGCGLTRSVLSLLHGEIFSSLRYNVAPLMLLTVGGLFWIELVAFLMHRPVKLVPRGSWFIYTLIGIFFLIAVLRLFVPGMQI